MRAGEYSIEELKQIITPLAEKYQIEKVFLFGSFARGDYDEKSDIDLYIEKGNLKGLFALCGFYTEITNALERKVDLLTVGGMKEDFFEQIRKEEVILYDCRERLKESRMEIAEEMKMIR